MEDVNPGEMREIAAIAKEAKGKFQAGKFKWAKTNFTTVVSVLDLDTDYLFNLDDKGHLPSHISDYIDNYIENDDDME